ncbi:MAG: Flp pilus assembly protein CpaB [Candidatus Omnitrophota bacterium]
MNIELKKRFPLIIAIACGVTAIVLLNLYVRKIETEIRYKTRLSEEKALAAKPKVIFGVVLVAKRSISAQAPITGEDLTFKQMPVEYIQPGAATTFEQIMGQISPAPIGVEEQILISRLSPPGNIGKTLAEITPEGKRAVTVPVNNLADIINMLKPGDYVDIFALIALPKKSALQTTEVSAPRLISLFQGVEVLAVGGETIPLKVKAIKERGGTGAAGSGQTATFALTPQEAVLLSFVQEHGKINLVLRSARDSQVELVAPADWDTLLNHLSSVRGERGSGERQGVVEIYRGFQKEIIPLSASNKEE